MPAAIQRQSGPLPAILDPLGRSQLHDGFADQSRRQSFPDSSRAGQAQPVHPPRLRIVHSHNSTAADNSTNHRNRTGSRKRKYRFR